MRQFIRALVLPVLCCALALGAETFTEMEQATDKSDPEAVFKLAEWCRGNNLPAKANQFYNQVLKMDKNHEGANAALGRVRVGDRWVNKQFAPGAPAPKPGGPAQGESGGGAAVSRSGPGPSADKVAWDLTLPTDPTPVENEFVAGYLLRMQKSANDSNEMAGCVVTFLREDVWPTAFPRLCAYLLTPAATDIYGPCEMIVELNKTQRMSEARRLFAFIAKASERVKDPEDLAHLCMAAQIIRDRRIVPRLAQLLTHEDQNVREAAGEAISTITFLKPAKDITADKARAWWDANWSLSEEQAWAQQLRSPDPLVAVAAAEGLCERRNKDIFPVLFRLLKLDDPAVNKQAINVIRRAVGLDWSYEASLPLDQRIKRVEIMEKWWKDEQFRFNWPGLPKPDSKSPGKPEVQAKDPLAEMVEKLASSVGNEAQEAEGQLRSRGRTAIIALISGLDNPAPLARRRAHDLLKELTKQDFKFDPRADEGERAKAVSAWRNWALREGLLKDATKEAADGK